jgi:methyl-accepting chemotaxis protein
VYDWLTGTDPFIDQMMKINQVACSVRSVAGLDRRLMATAITEARAPSLEQRQLLSEKDGIIGALWDTIDNADTLSSLPPQLKAAIKSARDVYFVHMRAMRNNIINKLTSGAVAPISGQDWVRLSTPGLDSIAAISDTALDLTKSYSEKQVIIANQNFYIAIVLMVLSIALASFATFYVMWRVIRPLKLITRSMRAIVDGDFKQKIPFGNRQDEVGEFAHTLRVFRDSAIEKQRLEVELLRKEAAKETAET